MKWTQVREHYPSRWLLVEAVQAHSEAGSRHVDDLAVLEEYGKSRDALADYLDHHRRFPQRELYIVHTDREQLDIDEREWLGLRQTG